MTPEERLAIWAAFRLARRYHPVAIKPEDVLKVEFVHADEYHYSDDTVDPAYDAANVTMKPVPATAGHPLQPAVVHSIVLTDENMGDIVREVLAVAETGDTP